MPLPGPVQSVRDWFSRNGEPLLLFSAIILIGVIGFEAGTLYERQQGNAKPLIITLPAEESGLEQADSSPEAVPDTGLKGVEPAVSTAPDQAKCLFVGSKNSDKYHLPTCAPAKRIKPENLVCFSSKEDAEKKGYVPGCLK